MEFKISMECTALIEEIKEDLRESGDCDALAIYELKQVKKPFSDDVVFYKALVSYDCDPLEIEEIKTLKIYKGCTFEKEKLSSILEIAKKQNDVI